MPHNDTFTIFLNFTCIPYITTSLSRQKTNQIFKEKQLNILPDCEGVEYHNRDHLLLITNGATPTIIKQNGGNGMKNKCYWTANKIKDVIKNLDCITWLEGRTLPVRFVNDENMLGDLVFMDGEPVEFQFSKRFLNDQYLPYSYALDTIKIQYAKYMNYMLGGDIGNTKSFVDCCREIMCPPVYGFNLKRFRRYRNN